MALKNTRWDTVPKEMFGCLYPRDKSVESCQCVMFANREVAKKQMLAVETSLGAGYSSEK